VDPVEAIRAHIATAPLVRAALGAILDRRERDGRMPRSLTVEVDPGTVDVLRELFTARAVTVREQGRARIDLSRLPATVDLERVLYAALDRAPRDLEAERLALRDALVAALAPLAPPSHPVARAFLAAERAAVAAASGDTWELARERGAAHAAGVVIDVVTALGALLELKEPVRIANFAARVLGDSKALAFGGERAQCLGAALLAHDPAIQAEVAAHAPRSSYDAVAMALEARGLFRDDASVLVHAFGPLVYRRGGETFDHVARHSALGDPAPLSLRQLRSAELVDLAVDRITLIEGQATFLDHVDRADARRELVVLARGQASWAVVALLRMCATVGAPVRHFGDLDRSGILILRSLARRSGVAIAPWHMDVVTHRRFASLGRPIEADERARVARLVALDDPAASCHDLLLELHRTGRWIEQEAFSHLALAADSAHSSPGTTAV
jgi:hypothetical protein